MGIIDQSRNYRDEKLKDLAKFFLKIKCTPNLMTTISFIFAVMATYFLFNNQYLFLFFAGLHLLADGLDGVMARLQGPTKFGQYYDHLVDRSMSLMILIKTGIMINHYFVIIIIALFILTQSIHFCSNFKYPIWMLRTALLIIMACNFFPFNHILNLSICVYLVTFGLTLNALTRQVLYWWKSKDEKKAETILI